MRALCVAIALVLASTGCKQIFGLESPTQLDAGGPIATVGFGSPTTLSDEASGVLSIPVLLTEIADREVTVSYSILGGTATEGEDYTIAQDLIVIPAGSQSATLDIEIAADQVLEDDETIELALAMPRFATLGLAQHTVTISATVLPRVNFVATSSTSQETNIRQSMVLSLDTPSTIPINVMLGTSGTATSPADFDLVANPITFAPGTTSQMVQVDVKHDTLDEDDETVVLTLSSADAAIVGTTSVHTLTISDNDNPPTVSLTPSNATVSEDGGTASITVQLNTPSGKDVAVPFTPGGTASVTTDYTYATTSPVTIPAGSMSTTITINLVNDTTSEPTEALTTSLGTPTNGQLGSPNVHTLTITDDEMVCVGPAGTPFAVCYATAPTQASTLPATLNTDIGSQCQSTQPVGWTAGGQPSACVIWATNISGANTVVTGTRPLVLATPGTITITGSLDAASRRNPARVGPGAPSALCAAFPVAPTSSVGGAGGGAGGSFMSKGGNGGPGIVAGGTAADADAAEPTVLRAGCSGQRGGMGDAGQTTPGAGGGAVYLAAGTAINVSSGAYITVSGAGADVVMGAGPDDAGGSGGGTGGMLRLHAPAFSVAGASFIANGGGGGEGNSETNEGNPGSDASVVTPAQPAPGGANGSEGGNGGSGFAGANAATSGLMPISPPAAGGGGGGGGGLIRSNLVLTGATTSAGSVVAQ